MTSEHREQQSYVSYLLRVRRVPGDSGSTWRVSLEEPRTQKIHHFKDLPHLFAFLLAETGQGEAPGRERAEAAHHPAGSL